MSYGVIPIEDRPKYTPEEAREEQLKLISEINLMKAYINNHLNEIREIHYPTIAANYVPTVDDTVYYMHKYILEPESEDLVWHVIDVNYKVKSVTICQYDNENQDKFKHEVAGIPWILITKVNNESSNRSETNQ